MKGIRNCLRSPLLCFFLVIILLFASVLYLVTPGTTPADKAVSLIAMLSLEGIAEVAMVEAPAPPPAPSLVPRIALYAVAALLVIGTVVALVTVSRSYRKQADTRTDIDDNPKGRIWRFARDCVRQAPSGA